MKRLAILALVVLVAAGGLAAQAAPSYPGYGPGPMMGPGYGPGYSQGQAAPQATSLEGKLAFVDGVPALVAKDKTYLIRMPRFYYYAYTDGIKEGVQVKVDGFEFPALPGQDKPWFQVTKAVIGGKTYDFTTQGGFGMMGGAWGGHGMMGGAYGGRGRGMMDGGNFGGPRGGRR